jgi:anti-sigma B factor antagonist
MAQVARRGPTDCQRLGRCGNSAPYMRLRESRHDRIHVFHLTGAIELHNAAALRSHLQMKVARRCPALILDLSGVSYIDSTGLALLIEYLRDAEAFGGHFLLVGLTDPVRHIFDIVQLHKALPIFRDLDEAKAKLRKGVLSRTQHPLFKKSPAETPRRMRAAA